MGFNAADLIFPLEIPYNCLTLPVTDLWL